MESFLSTEDGELLSDMEQCADGTNPSSPRSASREHDSGETSTRRSKSKKQSKYTELSKRFTVLEEMLQKVLNQNSASSQTLPVQGQTHGHAVLSTQSRPLISDDESEDESDRLSLFAGGQFSPSPSQKSDDENISKDVPLQKDENNNCSDSLTETTKKCLFDMFGDDAVVKKSEQKHGITLDKSQIEVLDNSYRCKQPNFLTAFSEENIDLFPVDTEAEKVLQVPSLDSLVECCLTKRYGAKASFVKGRNLFSQPARMVEKIAYKGQQAARLGLVMQMYIQQSLGNLLQVVMSDELNKEQTSQMVKDIFAMSTKCLDQIGRSGAFHHIARRAVCMTDTALYEQTDRLEFTNLPLTGDGVFGKGLETLLKDKKEKKKQVEDLIPDIRKKRKYSDSHQDHNAGKRPLADKFTERPSSSDWNNFRIPKVPRTESKAPRNRGGYRSGGYSSRKPATGRGKPVAKTDEK